MSSIVVSIFLCFALLLDSVVSQKACDEYCQDYHRICPAVKDPNFYTNYLTLHATQKLGYYQKNPVPPPPDCNDIFYKLSCPFSCGICKKCQCCDEEQKKPLECNPCTEKKKIINGNGAFICEPRYELVPGQKTGPCSCYCGNGTAPAQMLCKSFHEASDGSCYETISQDSSKCNGESLTGTQNCKDRDCMVTELVEKTLDQKIAAVMDDTVYVNYKAFTAEGEMCEIGNITGFQRVKGQVLNYDLNVKCDICMKDAEEMFERLTLRIDHPTNAWDPEFLELKVNDKSTTYLKAKPNSGRRMKAGNEIDFITKQAADAKKNKNNQA